jgi:NADPH-dependent ferric siderophore reductase
VPPQLVQSPTAPFLLHRVTVSSIRDVAPSFRRFTFTGEHLGSFADNGFDQRIKLVLPLEEHGLDTVPMHDDWYAAWRALPPERQNPVRTYTVRAVRPELREIDVDVVLHPVIGPASRWAEDAVIGSELVVLGPNARHSGFHGGIDFLPPARTDRFLIAGDETALPAIASILERLPASARGIAVIEVPLGSDCAYVPSHPGIEVLSFGRNGLENGAHLVPATSDAAAALIAEAAVAAPSETELADVDIETGLLWEAPSNEQGGPAKDSTPLYAWLAGEAGVIKALRRHLVADLGVDRRSVAFMGYWRLGRAEVA